MGAKSKTVKEPNTKWTRDLSFSDHGGGCCGRFHMFGFDNVDLWEDTDLTFRDKVAGLRAVLLDKYGNGRGPVKHGRGDRGYCIEVVLNQYQSAWSRALTTVGFKRVFTFVNENSGNTCYVYLLDTSKMK